jgi:hypothetical protein
MSGPLDQGRVGGTRMHGEFTEDGHEYLIKDPACPRPWHNAAGQARCKASPAPACSHFS